jgi:hypothetical protein
MDGQFGGAGNDYLDLTFSAPVSITQFDGRASVSIDPDGSGPEVAATYTISSTGGANLLPSSADLTTLRLTVNASFTPRVPIQSGTSTLTLTQNGQTGTAVTITVLE